MAPGFSPPLAEEDHGTLGHYVGEGDRFHIVSGKAVKVHLHLGQYRGGNYPTEAFRFRPRRFLLLDNLRFSHADPGHPFDEVPVHACPDPEGKHVGLSQVLPDQVEDLFLHGHVTVGDNDERPGVILPFL